MNLTEKNNLVRAALAEVNSKALNDEIDYFIEIDKEEVRDPDYYDALSQANDRGEEWNDRQLVVPSRRALIILGVVKVATEEQLARTETLGNRKKYWFKLDGKKYQFDTHL